MLLLFPQQEVTFIFRTRDYFYFHNKRLLLFLEQEITFISRTRDYFYPEQEVTFIQNKRLLLFPQQEVTFISRTRDYFYFQNKRLLLSRTRGYFYPEQEVTFISTTRGYFYFQNKRLLYFLLYVKIIGHWSLSFTSVTFSLWFILLMTLYIIWSSFLIWYWTFCKYKRSVLYTFMIKRIYQSIKLLFPSLCLWPSGIGSRLGRNRLLLLLLLLLLSNKLFKKLSQKLLAVRKHETNKKRWHEQQITECWSVNKYSSIQNN